MSGEKEYKTLELDKIAEENMEDSMRLVNPYKSIDRSSSRVSKKAS